MIMVKVGIVRWFVVSVLMAVALHFTASHAWAQG